MKKELIIIHRLDALRKSMQEYGLDVWVALTADPHLSEYLPSYWKTRAFLSGFTGSAGTLVITHQKAGLWTDSRYWEQAENQLRHTTIELFKMTSQSETYWDWIFKELKPNQTIGIDGHTLAYSDYRILKERSAKKNIHLHLKHDIVNLIWQDRPLLPEHPVFVHKSEYVSLTCQEKIKEIRQQMHQMNVDYHLISSLDDIAWVTNLRGSDVEYNPVFLAHLLISFENVFLFINQQKIKTEIRDYLSLQGISIRNYQEISNYIEKLGPTRLLIDENKVSYGTLSDKTEQTELQNRINPSTFLKSRKTPFELEHVHDCMVQDGIALCEFFCWLDQTIADQKIISELDIDTELTSRRSKQANFVSLSFNTIAGFNENSALPHYAATQDSYSLIQGDGILLIDSGGQYLNGTTDITRVVAINHPSIEQKKDFTLVLKSHIAMALLTYPEGIPMPMLDVVARAPLWKEFLDFGHGTGHGVGYFLNVHEGPQVLSVYSQAAEKTKVYAGMITSIEPGLYRPKYWGIRIENLAASVCCPQSEQNGYGKFLCFDILTLCPLDKRLIQMNMLTETEKNWLNQYHAVVKEKISPYVSGKYQDWLDWATQEI